MTGKPKIPSIRHQAARFFNLRRIPVAPSLVEISAQMAEEGATKSFMDRYRPRIQGSALSPVSAPLTALKSYLFSKGPFAPSRFSDGSFPVVYMGDTEDVCLREITYHLSMTLAETDAAKATPHLFQLAGFDLNGETPDVRRGFPRLHLKNDYQPSQVFGNAMRAQDALGITFRSVRSRGGTNVAVLQSTLVQDAWKVRTLVFRWNGQGVAVI